LIPIVWRITLENGIISSDGFQVVLVNVVGSVVHRAHTVYSSTCIVPTIIVESMSLGSLFDWRGFTKLQRNAILRKGARKSTNHPGICLICSGDEIQ
jgi:hypothetical protein